VLRAKHFERLLALRLHFLGAGFQVLVRLGGEQLQRHIQIAANNLIDDTDVIRLVEGARPKDAADLEKAVAELDDVSARVDINFAATKDLLALVRVLTGTGQR
jgi:triphosphoribosyl-dephospho-CoA synthetase